MRLLDVELCDDLRLCSAVLIGSGEWLRRHDVVSPHAAVGLLGGPDHVAHVAHRGGVAGQSAVVAVEAAVVVAGELGDALLHEAHAGSVGGGGRRGVLVATVHHAEKGHLNIKYQ